MNDKELLFWLRVEDTDLTDFAANRIEALEQERDRWKDRYRFLSGELDVVLAGRGDEYDRAEAAEAKLAKAVDALEKVQAFVRDLAPYADQGHALVPALFEACETLKELKGEGRG